MRSSSVVRIKLQSERDLIHAAPSLHPRLFFTVAMYTHERDVTIKYYPNPNPNHKKGTKFRSRIPNPNTEVANSRKGRLFATLALGLGLLD